MDVLSSTASAFAVVSLAVQLASSIKKLYEFWDSVQAVPEDIYSIKADLELLSTVLSEIALEVQQHQLPDRTLIIALNQCTVKVRVLNTLIDKFEPGFASRSRCVRNWSMIRAIFKDKKLKKFHVILERLKTTLILVQQNYCGRLNRSQNQILENRLTDLCQGLSSLSLKWSSKIVTSVLNTPFEYDQPLESDQHLEALRAEISRVANSISNPVYRHVFERATSKTLNEIFSKPEFKPNSDRVMETYLPDERIAETTLECGLANSPTWRKDCLTHQYYTSDHFFGTIHVERKNFRLQSCTSDDLDTCQYLYQTSFTFHPAPWLIMLGLHCVIRFNSAGSFSQGWKYTIETARSVPDNALIFEFCQAGDLDGVRSLLSNGQASVRDTDSLGRTPLYFAAENTLPELCKLLITSGADKGSRTYGPVNWSYSARSPITAAAHKIHERPGNNIEDCIEVFRLFEDRMDFSNGESDGWEALQALSQNAAAIPGCLIINVSILQWALRYFLSEVRTNFDKDHLMSLLWFATFQGSKEVVDILLNLNSDFIDFIDREDRFTPLLLRLSRDFMNNDLSTVLTNNPNLHFLGLDLEISPHFESPTSLSLYSSWVFYSWRRHLIMLGINIDEFVKQELEQEHSILADAGWKTETLRALFDYGVEADWLSDYDFRCSQCRRLSSIRVQPYWVQKGDRIKHGIDPDGDGEREYNKAESSSKSTFDEEGSVENASVISEPGILNRVYSKYMIVCIWCWEKHKENGYQWIDHTSAGWDNGDDSDHNYSPYLFQS